MAGPQVFADDAGIQAALGSLALSRVQARGKTLTSRAILWHNDLARLGVAVPLFLVHDIGLLFACRDDELELGKRSSKAEPSLGKHAPLLQEYERLIEEVAGGALRARVGGATTSDDLIVILLAHLLHGIVDECPVRAPAVTRIPYDPSLLTASAERLPALFQSTDRSYEFALLSELVARKMQVLTLVDAADLRAFELFGMLGGDTAHGGFLQVDLLSVLGSPEAHDVIEFALQILPSVLEAKSRPAPSSHPAFGYAGLTPKGSIDSMVLSELAWDEPELLRRLANDELLYYAREHAHHEERRLHHILIDASASMRGQRAMFARGMALATAKKLLLGGEDVTFRFFDSRLYEAHAAERGKLPLGNLLAFRGERGRNPARVFAELGALLEARRARDTRDVAVYVFTHAGLYIPRETVKRVAQAAKVFGIFCSPSGGELELEYLDLLRAHWVVDNQALSARSARANEARRILSDIDQRGSLGRAGPQ